MPEGPGVTGPAAPAAGPVGRGTLHADDALDALALEAAVAHRVPGVAVGVVSPSGLRVGVAGVAAAGEGPPMTADHAANWFSMTKIATATAAVALASRGALDLDEPVGTFLGEAWPPAFAEVRVRHLLSHSSGLANPLPIRWVHRPDQPRPPAATFLASQLARQRRPRFPAGARAAYSNIGYLALGEVLAAAVGRPIEQVVGDEVLTPLGMTRTSWSWADRPPGPRMVAHHPMRRPTELVVRRLLPRGIVGERHGRLVSLEPFDVDGAAYGGLVGPIGDALALLAAHLDLPGGGAPILSGAARRAMRTVEATGRDTDAGLGWLRPHDARGSRRLHFGGGMGYWHVLVIDPERAQGACVLSNTGRRWDLVSLADRAMDLV